MFAILGTLIIWVGIALWLLGALAFLVAAFRENVLWGLAVFFLPVAALVFLVLHWPRAKNAFFLELWGLGVVMLGALVFKAHLPWPLG